MQNLEVRLARVSDAENIAHVAEVTFRETYENTSQIDKANIELYIRQVFTPQAVRQNFSNQNISYFVAEVNNQAVAYAKIVRGFRQDGIEAEKVINLEKIYVFNAYIGKGIGRALMNKIIEVARNEKYEMIWLGVWKINGKAIGFYEKLGFEHCGDYPFKMGNQVYNDWMMKKEL